MELIFLLIIVISVPIGLVGLLFYFVPKKLGFPKVAKYLTCVYAAIVLITIFFIVFEDQLFTKRNAVTLIEEQNIKLHDDFILTNNRSSSAIGDYYHTFTLKISDKDKKIAISEIVRSKNFNADSKSIDKLLYLKSEDRYFGPKIVQNYETESDYVREYFQPSGKKGYAPTFRRISISKTGSELKFEDIDE